MGYTKRNKICIPKEGMPHTHKVCQKRERERERKRKYSPYQQKKLYKGKRIHIKEFSSTIQKKIPTHLHILTKAYDLFLLWIRSLT